MEQEEDEETSGRIQTSPGSDVQPLCRALGARRLPSPPLPAPRIPTNQQQPQNYPTWTLVSPATPGQALGPSSSQPGVGVGGATAEPALPQIRPLELPDPGPSSPWQPGPSSPWGSDVKSTFPIIFSSLGPLPWEWSHIPEEECVVPGIPEGKLGDLGL